jgi:hypothetical protein
MSGFVYTCPACKTGYFLSANAEPPWFAACPKCGHLVVTAGGQQDSPSIPAIDADYWRTRAERAEAALKDCVRMLELLGVSQIPDDVRSMIEKGDE